MEFSKKLFSPVAIAVYGDNLYWLDINMGSGYEKLKWCPIHNYARKKISNFPRIFENTNDLLIVNLERRNGEICFFFAVLLFFIFVFVVSVPCIKKNMNVELYAQPLHWHNSFLGAPYLSFFLIINIKFYNFLTINN